MCERESERSVCEDSSYMYVMKHEYHYVPPTPPTAASYLYLNTYTITKNRLNCLGGYI